MTLTPRPYQEQGRDFLAARKFALLADEMRVGKTPQAILAAAKAGAQRMLVLCPAIAVPQWKSETERWWPADTRLPAASVLSYQRALKVWQTDGACDVDVFIADECHFASNPAAQRTKMVYGKNGFAMNAGATWALSGTPATKHAGNLWPMFRAFGITKMDYEQFCRHHCTYDRTGERVIGTRADRISGVKSMLARIMLRRTRKEVAPQMPGIDYQFLNVEPVSRVDLSAANVNAFTTDVRGGNVDTENRVEVAKVKALPLVEHIDFAIHNELLTQTVVFGWHIEGLEAVVKGLEARGIKADLLNGSTSPKRRVEIQEDFRHGRTQVVCANILAAGTAIDLSAASHGFFLELDWLPSNNVQAANRLVSMTKNEPVTFDIVTWPGSRDDNVQRILLTRAKQLANMLS